VRKLPETEAEFAAFRFPAPEEWRRVVAEDPENFVIPDDVIRVIWPDR
jgi:hypothetical protein